MIDYMYKGSLHKSYSSQKDEIKEYLSRRNLCPNECVYRILGFPSCEFSHPVRLLNLHVLYSDGSQILMEKQSKSRFFKFIQFCSSNRLLCANLTWPEVYTKLTWCTATNNWKIRERTDMNPVVSRLYNSLQMSNELKCLRLLAFVVKCPLTIDDYKFYEGNHYNTYEEACLARGLIRYDIENRNGCLGVSRTTRNGKTLLMFLLYLFIYNSPARTQELWDLCFDQIRAELDENEIIRIVYFFFRFKNKSLVELEGIPFIKSFDFNNFRVEFRDLYDENIIKRTMYRYLEEWLPKLKARQLNIYVS